MLAVGVHFPKAGGNSLLAALRAKHGAGLLLDYADDPALPESYRQLEPQAYPRTLGRRLPDDTTCVFGHFHPAKYRTVENAVRFTVLRDPVDTMISIYFYWQSQQPTGSLHRYVRDQQMPILRMAQMPILRRLMSFTYFGGYDMKQFDYIGRFEDSTHKEKLADLLGLERFDHIHENKTPETYEQMVMLDDPNYRGSLYEILAEDVKFYEKWAMR